MEMKLLSSNIKKSGSGSPEKISLYFGKWNFFALILKKFRKRKPSSPKKFPYILGNRNPKNVSYISGKETFSGIVNEVIKTISSLLNFY